MNEKLDKALCEKYPKIFADRHKSPQITCMHWGFCCGDGWYNIIDMMCAAMTNTYETGLMVDEKTANLLGLEYDRKSDPDPLDKRYFFSVKTPQLVASQVKEKYGTLRFYYRLEFDPKFNELAYGTHSVPEAKKIADGYGSFFDGIVHMGEIMSSKTCEVTGAPGELHVGGGWYRTLNPEYARFLSDRPWVPYKEYVKSEL